MSCEKREFVCLWRMKNFSFGKYSLSWITSPAFEVELLHGTKWRILFNRGELLHTDIFMLECLNKAADISYLKVTNVLKCRKDILCYRFELLDNSGTLLNYSSIRYFDLTRCEQICQGEIKDEERSEADWPEDVAIIRCTLMRIECTRFNKSFNGCSKNQIVDISNCDCDCKTILGIDRFSFLLKDIPSSTETKPLPTSLPFCIEFKSIPSEEMSIAMSYQRRSTFSPSFVRCKISLLQKDGIVIEYLEKEHKFEFSYQSYRMIYFIPEIKLHNKYYLKFDIVLPNLTQFDEVNYSLPSLLSEAKISASTSKEKISKASQTNDCVKNEAFAPMSEENVVFTKAAEIYENITISTQTDENYLSFKLAESGKTISSSLQDDLNTILKNEAFTDVNLKVQNTLIPVHKALLVARSPVFSAMFSRDMLESHSGTICVSDVDEDTVKLFLKYIYTDSVEMNGHENAIKLMTIADKYEVLSLKENCSSYLKTILSDGNVCEVIAIADMLHQEDLKLCAMDYIKGRASTVLSTPEWTRWLRQNLELAAEIVAKVSSELVISIKLK